MTMTPTPPPATPAKEAETPDTAEEAAKQLLKRWWDERLLSWQVNRHHEEELAGLLRAAAHHGASRCLRERVEREGLAGVLDEIYDLTDDRYIRSKLHPALCRAHRLEGYGRGEGDA